MLSFDRRYLVAALICGLVAGGALYSYLRGLERKVTASSRYTQVVVAARALPLRTRLEKEDLKLVRILRSAKEEGDLTSIEEAVGKVVTVKLLAGQKIKGKHLLPLSELGGIAHEIPPLWRAVTIRADEGNSLCGMLVPGDRVDLFAVAREGDEGKLLASNRQVLAVGQELGLKVTGGEGKYLPITLLVHRDEAAKIAQAEEGGNIRIALRSLDEEPLLAPPKQEQVAATPKRAKKTAAEPPPKVQTKEVYIQVPVAQPSALPSEPEEPVLVVRGSKVERVYGE